MSRPSSPIRIALVDDYDVVVIGLAHMLTPFGDRITVVELDVQQPVSVDVDIALYDTFAQPESDRHDIHALLDNAHAAKVVIYTWSFDPALIAAARRVHSAPGLDWPGRAEGLTDREAEILALITQGRGNAEIAAMTYLSPNTIKSYIRSVYRKIGVSSRTQAVLWGVHHGFAPTSHRLDDWRSP
jgi:DNA-binding NarL/FixJ family response regulator